LVDTIQQEPSGLNVIPVLMTEADADGMDLDRVAAKEEGGENDPPDTGTGPPLPTALGDEDRHYEENPALVQYTAAPPHVDSMHRPAKQARVAIGPQLPPGPQANGGVISMDDDDAASPSTPEPPVTFPEKQRAVPSRPTSCGATAPALVPALPTALPLMRPVLELGLSPRFHVCGVPCACLYARPMLRSVVQRIWPTSPLRTTRWNLMQN
jgi:hypothetical protein